MPGQPVIREGIGLLSRLLDRLPHERAVRLGGFLGRAIRHLQGERLVRAEARAERALGVSPSEARRILIGSFDHFGRAAAEFLRLPRMVPLLGRYVEVQGEEHLRAALARGRGVLLLSAHLGNWEYGAAELARRGYPINALGAEQRDPGITDLIARIRSAAGLRPLGKGFDLKLALGCLRRGEALAILLDQDAKSRGIVSPFLGRPASTPIGPVKLAAKTGAVILPSQAIRLPDGVRHLLRILPPLEEAGGEPLGGDLQASVDLCNRVLGEMIREHPEQWLWIYPRWQSTLND
jgi:KDO2-lipid IV(A) lauroyltransferase